MKQLDDFGKFLEGLRGKMSLREAAQKSGLSHAYIRDLELERNRSTNDKIKPSPDTLKKLSDAYHISYTELMEKVGYLEIENPTASIVDINMNEVLYIEIETKEVAYHTSTNKINRNINSLVDFSEFIENIEDIGYLKLDTNLFINLNQIKKYAIKEGKLYFSESDTGKVVTISSIRQKKYHELLLRTVATNTNSTLAYHYSTQASANPLLSLNNSST